jgi:uncharacterized iron-regulated membrane protein
MRKYLLLIHLTAAQIAGLVLIILGGTGCIMAFESELDRLFNPRLFHAAPGTAPLPIAAIQAALARTYPKDHFSYLSIPTSPDETYAVAAHGQQIFINGYTGEVVGTRQLPTLLGQIHTLHLTLFMGRNGGLVTGIAALVLILLIATGLILWWPGKRIAVKLHAPPARVISDSHHAAGIVFAAFLLVLAITGAAITWNDAWAPWAHRVMGTSPPVRDLPSTVLPGAHAISAEEALAVARRELPGAVPFALSLPATAGSYHIALRFPEDLTPGGRSWVNVDQYSGATLSVTSSRASLGATGLVTLNRALHTGDVFGLPSKVVASLASLVLVLQTLSGWFMWWRRRQARRAAASAAAAPAGAA